MIFLQTFQKLWAKIAKFGRCTQVMVLMKPTKFCFDRSRRCPESILLNYKSKSSTTHHHTFLNKDQHQNSVLSLFIWANFGRNLTKFVGRIANSFVFVFLGKKGFKSSNPKIIKFFNSWWWYRVELKVGHISIQGGPCTVHRAAIDSYFGRINGKLTTT